MKDYVSDNKTLQLLDLVKKQRDEIESLQRPNWRTNCQFSFKPAANANTVKDSFNIHTTTDVSILVLAASFLVGLKSSVEEANKLLGTSESCTWLGYTFDDWFHDFKTRIGKLQISAKKLKLAKLEARLDAVISPELKAKLELEAIQRELSDG